MLTKEERKEIAKTAESLSDCTLYYSEIYKCLYGEYQRNDMPNMEYDKAILDRLIELCDTSNMIELPLDKDGEVIRIGDMVDNVAEGKIYRVKGYEFKVDGCLILLASDRSHIWTYSRPNVLAHKKPVTIASVRKQLKHVLDKGEMTSWSMAKLFDITDQLEKLGDSDAN